MPAAPLPSLLLAFSGEIPLLHFARRHPLTSFVTPVKTEQQSGQCLTASHRATTPTPGVVTASWVRACYKVGMGRPGQFGLGPSR
jgi:hypothetical protein